MPLTLVQIKQSFIDNPSQVGSVNLIRFVISSGLLDSLIDLSTTVGAIDTTGATHLVAHEDLIAFHAVTSTGLNGDSSNSAHFGKVIGIIPEAIANTFSDIVVLSGVVLNGLWTWTPGDRIYLNGTSLSNTPPGSGFVQCLGVAETATTIFVEPHEPILL